MIMKIILRQKGLFTAKQIAQQLLHVESSSMCLSRDNKCY